MRSSMVRGLEGVAAGRMIDVVLGVFVVSDRATKDRQRISATVFRLNTDQFDTSNNATIGVYGPG